MTTVTNEANSLTAFHWTPQPQAEQLIYELVDPLVDRSPWTAVLRQRLQGEAAVRLVDLVDHLLLLDTPEMRQRLREAGFQQRGAAGQRALFLQEQGIFPTVLLDPAVTGIRLAVKVESVADFESVWQTGAEIVGGPLAPLRMARMWSNGDDELWSVERHGDRGFRCDQPAPAAERVAWHADRFRLRPRKAGQWRRELTTVEGFDAVRQLFARAAADLGTDYACDLFFAAERDYWQRRNRAGQVQKARQDRLGIGWANHDHHTYRSSREHFARLIGVFEAMGFRCRERFYAGREAGWGAQVLEQPQAGIVIFADVDLSPDELFGDFAHEPLAERHELGTVGLWCALHGESLLAAGMHHLECQFAFDALRHQLASEAGIGVMPPFTDFPYLRQAFTAGERWTVDPARIDALLAAGRISAEQAAAFAREGAIGSHLENLERNAGFKGFNQTGVSQIIAATDPRKHLATG